MPESPARKARLLLTKKQLETALGVELLSLCQTVTADGQLIDDEVLQLKAWVEAHTDEDLPAISHLGDVLTKVLADGKVTADEFAEVYRTLEAILPPEARREARSSRCQVEATVREEARAAKARDRHEKQEERARSQPIARANFMVAGVRYEGRQDVITRHVEENVAVRLVRDPKNKFSAAAIKVVLDNWRQIGFVPEEDAVDLAPVLDQGAQQEAWVTKILGYNSQIPVVQAYLYRSDADLATVTRRPPALVANLGATDKPATRKRPQSSTNLTDRVLIGFIVLILIWLLLR